MKILVTGGAGFMGCNFVRYWVKKYPEDKIVVLDKLTYAGSLENLRDVRQKVKFIKGDICDKGLVEKLMQDADVVVHFAAETHNTRAERHPEIFYKTNVKGTRILLEAAKKHLPNKFIHISCYDEKTRALTTEGFKTYKELERGDRVFSLNPVTQQIEVKPVEKVIVQSYQGKMIHFQNKRIDLLVTTNHNMFILNTKKKLIIEPAKKSSKRSIFYMSGGKWKGRKENYFKIPNHPNVETKDLFYILGVFIGDGFTAYQEQLRDTKTGLSRKIYLQKAKNPQDGKFQAIEKQGNHQTRLKCYRIFFDLPESDRCRSKVKRILSKWDVHYHSHKGKAGTHLYFSSKEFSEIFGQCGQGAKNKHIPRWALEYAPEYLQFLFDGLMDSDGHAGKVYHTVSEQLVSDFCELCFKLGLKPTLGKRSSKSFIKERKIEGAAHWISVAETNKSIWRHRNKIVDYNGKIWCLKVKDNKNFIVERNGKLDFCGNTDEIYGSIKKGFFKEEDADRRYRYLKADYPKSKAQADKLARQYAKKGTPVIIARPTNYFGPYEHPEKAIPRYITNVFLGNKMPVWGKGLQVRDWLYTEDCCRAIDLLIFKGKIGEAYNIATNNQPEIRNRDVARILCEAMNLDPKKWVEFVPDPRPHHDFRYALSTKKIRKLGWQPSKNIKKLFSQTVKWYRKNSNWWKKRKTEAEKLYR